MIATVYLLLAALTLGAPLPHVPLAPHAATLRIAVVGDTGEGSDRVANGIAKLHARTPLDALSRLRGAGAWRGGRRSGRRGRLAGDPAGVRTVDDRAGFWFGGRLLSRWRGLREGAPGKKDSR